MNAKEILIECSGFKDSDVIVGDRGPMPEFSASKSLIDSYNKAILDLENSHMTFSDFRRDLSESNKARLSRYRKMFFDCSKTNEQYEEAKRKIEGWVPPTKEHERIKYSALDWIKHHTYDEDLISSMKQTIADIICCEENVEDVYRYAGLVIHEAERLAEDRRKTCEADVENKEEAWKFRNRFFASIKDL